LEVRVFPIPDALEGLNKLGLLLERSESSTVASDPSSPGLKKPGSYLSSIFSSSISSVDSSEPDDSSPAMSKLASICD